MECARLNVDVTSPRFRRCFENRAGISYSNTGGVIATGTLLRIEVNPFFIDISSSTPFMRQGDFLTFELGDLAPYTSGRVDLSFTVSCNAELGQYHCLIADIDAPEKCPLVSEVAYVAVEPGSCTGDSLSFLVTNFGPVPMSIPLAYTIYEDAVRNFNLSDSQPGLAAGETVRLSFPASGATVHLVVNQEPGTLAPAFPAAAISGCNGMSTGFTSVIATKSPPLSE
ncbi:MAG: hypothetical protein ACI81P_002554 [Neolewinella sp.]